ncbi:hypothetical protein RJ640_010227 [Escallonia rubra]|uniref:Tr-type G domain-containing protein n=1 Tax=Escallonia rubra TaxID=112253 RepID=A0AA88UJN1_9ASTE|nr:hypothetical protein RJ640_010227 [Escallonia rubra]
MSTSSGPLSMCSKDYIPKKSTSLEIQEAYFDLQDGKYSSENGEGKEGELTGGATKLSNGIDKAVVKVGSPTEARLGIRSQHQSQARHFFLLPRPRAPGDGAGAGALNKSTGGKHSDRWIGRLSSTLVLFDGKKLCKSGVVSGCIAVCFYGLAAINLNNVTVQAMPRKLNYEVDREDDMYDYDYSYNDAYDDAYNYESDVEENGCRLYIRVFSLQDYKLAYEMFYILVDVIVTLLQQGRDLRLSKNLLGLEYGVVPFVRLIMKRACLHVISVGFFGIPWSRLVAVAMQIELLHRLDLFHAVGGMCKDSGASKMAKSLFASLPHRTPQKAVIFQPQNDLIMTEDCNFCKPGKFQGHFHDFYKAFSSENRNKVHLDPFKFDAPSPDDLVSIGLRSSKNYSKVCYLAFYDNSYLPILAANINKLFSLDVPSGIREEDTEREFGAKSSNSSSALVSKVGRGSSEVKSYSSTGGSDPQAVTSKISNLSLNAKSESLKNADGGGALSRSEYKPEKWMLLDPSKDRLSQLNLAIVGHVDSGKSTISGRLLHLLGRISKKQMHKNEKEAKQQGKGSFAYAWALDESAEERERGITMTVAVAYFDSNNYRVVLLDSPGHKDFVPNLISGATQADAAILVIDASLGSFEAGMEGMDGTGGQTREHAQLIRSFGVEQIIVAVNKMDVVGYSKERFDIIKQQLGMFLRSRGFKDTAVSWIPLSAVDNQNLVASASEKRLLNWYQGPCLLDAIDSLQSPARDYSKPLLMPICDVVKSQSQGQVSACGKLEAGALRSGYKVLVMPAREIGVVRSLERDSQTCDIARAGDNVAVILQGIDWSRVMAGGVLCHPDFPVAVASHLELKVLVLDGTSPILIGSQLEFHIHHARQAARVARIISLLDPKTGKMTKKSPRCLVAKQSAVVEVVLQAPVCVEEFSSSRALGRVFLRSLGRTVAVGVVTQVKDGQQ